MNNVKIFIEDMESITSDHNLYCDPGKRSLRDLGESLIYIGNALGLLIFSYLADN